MEKINSQFEVAPLNPEIERRIVAKVQRIMSQIGEFEDQPIPIDMQEKLIPDDYIKQDLALNKRKEKMFYSAIQYILDSIDARVATLLEGKVPIGVNIWCTSWSLEDENLPIGEWHLDDEVERVFIAFGDIADIECINGEIELEDFEDDNVVFAVENGLKAGSITATSIPNNCPVILKPHTIHRKGPHKAGRRLTLDILYSYGARHRPLTIPGNGI
ncbi:MAG: hypothetical protein AAB373_03785 [Patescibacteria group bacterium]